MANLPKERLECLWAFAVSGVDYCGPFFYKSEVPSSATYACSSALQAKLCLELVKDLTTASFLSALKILMSTRGRPSQIWADNATNL